MKKNLTVCMFLIANVVFAQLSTNPSPFEVNQSVTITIDANSNQTDCNGFNNPSKVYMHSGIGNESEPWGFSVVGNWGQDDGVGEMINNGDGTWSITIIPSDYYNLTNTQISNATNMGLVFRNENGSQEFKDNGCSDFFIEVGSFQVDMINPDNSGLLIVNSGDSVEINAVNTGGNANYQLYSNNNLVDTQNSTTTYEGFVFDNIQDNKYCKLVVTQGSSQIIKFFSILVNSTENESIPSNVEDGINYISDNSVVLVLDAPYKDFVYVSGSFNNWEPDESYIMKKDPDSSKFWLVVDNLDSDIDNTYQYWVVDLEPLENSPQLVKTADPYSHIVLSPFDDPWIPENSYPSLPTYPEGQEREVTLLNLSSNDYNWQVENFEKPKKEDLIIYEVLIRDFDSERTFQNLIDKIDYFKNLNINAIELMPVMEFEGNESWGYNTAFHMAIDKFYGPENKLKEFIDLCHQNGIAVILDLVMNHVMGRSPMNRMWMHDPDKDGWGPVSTENPYFNLEATHSYSLGNDFNHQSTYTQYYTERVLKRWIEDFKIDGIRWDLTKGFTQNCNGNDFDCTNGYQQDRVDVLKNYADYSWSLDPDHYVIFEHLGGSTEEQQWANYRVNEGKGIMLWGKTSNSYFQLAMGYAADSNISGIGHESRGFTEKRLVGYFESHDEERIMYKALQYGNSWDGYNIQDLNTSLSRMSAIGAISLTIPGPKMIWHFSDLGMENSLFTCYDGSVYEPDCKLDTKPQPQWAQNWLSNENRNQIYSDWSKIINLKVNEDVFEGDYSISSGGLTPIIYIWDDNIDSSELKNIVIVANLDVVENTVIPSFPYIGTWYNLMDENAEDSITITSTTDPVSLAPGEFKIYGNQASTTLSSVNLVNDDILIYPNPAYDYFIINKDIELIEIFDVSGKLVKSFKNMSANQFINIESLETGYYFMKLKVSNYIYNKKLLKR